MPLIENSRLRNSEILQQAKLNLNAKFGWTYNDK